MRTRIAAGLLLVGPVAAQTTWTVHSAGGAQFTAIAPAIAAAAPGDRIQVLGPGPYGSFVVDRGVDVESVTGAISGAIEVVGIPLGQRARVSGFVVDQNAQAFVAVRTCAGEVVIANTAYTGASNTPSGARPGLEVLASNNVVVAACDFRGHDDAVGGAPGIALVDAQVAFCGGSALGGVRRSASSTHGDDGRAGIVLTNSHATMRTMTLRGGPSGNGTLVGGSGGDALAVVSGQALVLGQSQLRAGFGGSGATPGAHGHAARGNVRYTADTFLIGSAATAAQIANRPVLTAPGGVAIGATLDWFVTGEAGALVWPALDLSFAYVPLPVFDSALVVTGGALLAPAVTLDSQGTGVHSLAIPNDPALRHLEVFAQGVAFVGGALVLTGATATHIL